ncbi:MAG: hypothetical protein WKF84_10700 [Pyrinomonadaceae bacterium]
MISGINNFSFAEEIVTLFFPALSTCAAFDAIRRHSVSPLLRTETLPEIKFTAPAFAEMMYFSAY